MNARRARDFLAVAVSLILPVLACAPIASYGDDGTMKPAGGVEEVRVSLTRTPLASLVILAFERKYFSDEGLNVILSIHPLVRDALDSLFKSGADFAVVPEIPLALAAFQRNDFNILAVVGRSDNDVKIVGRKDLGIRSLGDLRGKRIGIAEGTAIHFFFSLLLLKHDLQEKELRMVFLKPGDFMAALGKGDIDAFVMREPYIVEAQQRLAHKAVVFSEPGLYRLSYVLATMKGLEQQKPGTGRRFLRALVRAEDFASRHPERARHVVSGSLGVSETDLSGLWHNLDLRVSLDQCLILCMEDEARWAIRRGIAGGNRVPNYLDFLHPDSLKSVKPAVVTVIY